MAFLQMLLSTAHFVLTVFAGMVGIGFIIGFHELGHFLFCKLFNISTPSFSIGFGPRLYSKKIGETEFSFSLIPAGGYVEIAGNAEVGQGEQKEAYSTDERSFGPRPWYQKTLVMLGGIGFNILFAYIVLSLVFMIGAPPSPLLLNTNISNAINAVMPDSAAEKAGLRRDDFIQSIEFPGVGGPIIASDLEDILRFIRLLPGQTGTITITRSVAPGTDISADDSEPADKKTISLPITIGSKDIGGTRIGSLGIEFQRRQMQRQPLLVAIKNGIALTNLHIMGTFSAFKSMFAQRDASGVGGPIMIISATSQAFTKGFDYFLLLLAIISINLAPPLANQSA
jgi:regulator of sigma E protease